jgi:hypothetical protein
MGARDDVRRSRRALFTFLAAAVTTASAAFPIEAAANNYRPRSGQQANCTLNSTGGNNSQDPNPHTFFYSNLTPSVVGHMNWARSAVLDPTGVDTTAVGSPTSVTDVVAYDEDYTLYCGGPWHPQPAGSPRIIGLAVCVTLTSNSACEKHEVRFDLSWWNGGEAHDAARRAISCHELGHTLGLAHEGSDPGGCMPAVTSRENFSEHDVSHVNGGWQTLYPGWQLHPGIQLVSWDGRFRAVMQHDGNFVLRDPNNNAMWASHTYGEYNYAQMQHDGNFVIYDRDAWGPFPVCATGTFVPGTYMRMQTDGNLVMYRPNGTAIWATGSGGQCVR